MLESLVNKFPNMEWPIIIFIMILGFFFGPLPLFRKYKFLKMAIKVEGIISSFYVGDRGETYAVIHYVFNKKTYQKSIEWYPSYTDKEGKCIKVYINPNDNNQVQTRFFREELFLWIITISWLLPIFSFVMYTIYQ